MPTKTILVAVAFLLMLTAISANAAGQVAGQPYRIGDREVTRLLDRIKNKTGGFRQSLKNALNKSRLDRTRREEDTNAFVKAFEEDTKRLDDHFDHHKSTVADVDSVLQRATRIDTFMTAHPLDARTEAARAPPRSGPGLLAS